MKTLNGLSYLVIASLLHQVHHTLLGRYEKRLEAWKLVTNCPCTKNLQNSRRPPATQLHKNTVTLWKLNFSIFPAIIWNFKKNLETMLDTFSYYTHTRTRTRTRTRTHTHTHTHTQTDIYIYIYIYIYTYYTYSLSIYIYNIYIYDTPRTSATSAPPNSIFLNYWWSRL